MKACELYHWDLFWQARLWVQRHFDAVQVDQRPQFRVADAQTGCPAERSGARGSARLLCTAGWFQKAGCRCRSYSARVRKRLAVLVTNSTNTGWSLKGQMRPLMFTSPA
jgi:hypothetical protein